MDAPRDWQKTDAAYGLFLAQQYHHEGRGKSDPFVAEADDMIPWDASTILDVGSGTNDAGFTAQADLGGGIDFHWLPYPDGAFDCVRARHALEHSPMPALALAEWRRVAGKYLFVIVPELSPYIAEYPGHWSVFPDYGWRALFQKCGLRLLKAALAPWTHNRPGTGEPVTLNEHRYLLGVK